MYEFFCYKFPFKNKERPANASFMPAKLCEVLPVVSGTNLHGVLLSAVF